MDPDPFICLRFNEFLTKNNFQIFCFIFSHIFADLDPDLGSQNLADPTDPDPKHW